MRTAMNLNMPIGKKANKYPTKTTLNLAQKEVGENSFSKVALPAILIVVIVFAFVKFGIYDQFAAVKEANQSLETTKSQLDDMNDQLLVYEETEKQYRLYSYGYLSEEEAALVDRTEVLDMIEQRVMGISTVYDIQISKNTLVVGFTGVTLERVGDLTSELRALPTVAGVSVTTASTERSDSGFVAATMLITLQKAQEGEVQS